MIDNQTPFAAACLPCTDAAGKACTVLVAKATLDWNGQVVAPERALPVMAADVFHTRPEWAQTLLYESDAVPFKPYVDVLLNAVAWAPGGALHRHFEASVHIATATQTHTRTLALSGPRQWQAGLGGLQLSPGEAEGVRSVPVVYPLAYGGQDGRALCRLNPFGTGWFDHAPKPGQPLPQVEWADDRLSGHAAPKSAAGLGCFPRIARPRIDWSGQYTSEESGAPGAPVRLPRNFQPRAWNCAHPALQFEPLQLRAGTTFELRQLSREGYARFVLPRVSLSLRAHARGSWHQGEPLADTVLFEPELDRVALTWRLLVPEPPRRIERAEVVLGRIGIS